MLRSTTRRSPALAAGFLLAGLGGLAGCASAPPAADPASTFPPRRDAAASPAPPASPYSEADITYAAARLQAAEFGYADALCADGPHREPLAAAHAAFERAYPEYRLALDGPAPAAAVVDATDALVIDFLRVHEPIVLLWPQLSPAERDGDCRNWVERRAGTDFAARRVQTREALESRLSPPPET